MKLYKFHWNCGRGGRLDGIFVADDRSVKRHLGKEVYFGEVLGKHSEVEGTLDEEDLKVLTDDQEFIKKFVALGCSAGFNPIQAILDSEEESEGEDEDE